MELWLIWVIAGFALVIAELLTGTFYLLVVGIGAFMGGLIAWAGGNVLDIEAVAEEEGGVGLGFVEEALILADAGAPTTAAVGASM